MLSGSTVFSHCFFIAHKDLMKGNEKKRIIPIFFSLVDKFFDETMVII